MQKGEGDRSGAALILYVAPAPAYPAHGAKGMARQIQGSRHGVGRDREYDAGAARRRLGVGTKTRSRQARTKYAAWDALNADQKRTLRAVWSSSRASEAQFANYEMGRGVDAVENIARCHNHTQHYILGDNGRLGGGGPRRLVRERTGVVQWRLRAGEKTMKVIDEARRAQAYKPFPRLGLGDDTPFQWTKQVRPTSVHRAICRNSWQEKIRTRVASAAVSTMSRYMTTSAGSGHQAPTCRNGVSAKSVRSKASAWPYQFTTPGARSAEVPDLRISLQSRDVIKYGWMLIHCISPVGRHHGGVMIPTRREIGSSKP